jgi:hypothetical protein
MGMMKGSFIAVGITKGSFITAGVTKGSFMAPAVAAGSLAYQCIQTMTKRLMVRDFGE